MARLLALVVMGALASACVYHHRWVKPGATAEDFSHDKLRCNAVTGGLLLPDGTTTKPPSRAEARDRLERCLRRRGWHDVGVVRWGSGAKYAGPGS